MELEEVSDCDLLAMLENVTKQWIEEHGENFEGSTSHNEDLQVEELLDTTDLQQVSTKKYKKCFKSEIIYTKT